MSLGISILLAAAGAVLVWGVETSVAGVDLDTIGVILLVVGIAGTAISLVYWSSWRALRDGGDERFANRH